MAKYAPLLYRDLLLRIGLCLIAAHVMTHFDEHDSIWEAIFTQSYWRSFIASFAIAMMVCALIRYISLRLDRYYHWVFDTLPRALLQFFIGVLLPCFLTLILVGIYFAVFGRNILETEYIKEDYIVACMMILTLNVFYFGVSLYYQLRKMKCTFAFSDLDGDTADTDVIPEADKESEAPAPDTDNHARFREVIIVNTPLRSIPVKTKDTCYIYVLDGTVFLRTFTMEKLSESHTLDESLKELEDSLDPRIFFRINRQMIVHFDAVREFHPYVGRTLILTLEPPPYNKEQNIPDAHQRLNVVSEDRVVAFKAWMDR